MKLRLSLIRATLVCVSAIVLASSAYARNDEFTYPVADAMNKSRAREVIGDMPLRFGPATLAKDDILREDVIVTGVGSTGGDDPRQRRAVPLTDEQRCVHAFDDALAQLVAAARAANGAAIVGVVSNYRGTLIKDGLSYECHSGGVRSYVSLMAQVARTNPAARTVPHASAFAQLADANAVPLSEAGKDRYRHFLTLPSPRAFVVFEDGHWYMTWKDPEAMTKALDYCARVGKRCWLYAADDRVVWSADVSQRIGSSAQLSGGAAPTALVESHQ